MQRGSGTDTSFLTVTPLGSRLTAVPESVTRHEGAFAHIPTVSSFNAEPVPLYYSVRSWTNGEVRRAQLQPRWPGLNSGLF